MGRCIEIGVLVALCIFLPLYEAPKNILWLAYALVWLANPTAIYLAIMLGVCASWLFIARERLLPAAVTLIVLAALFIAASRGGVLAGLLTLIVLALAWWPRSRLPAALVGAALAAAAA